jgi:hypothetical protein
MEKIETPNVPRNFSLDSFAKANEQMIATNDRTYGAMRSSYWGR